jgi:signal transduction histidine kinase/ligand-binding sensor domain-containing protein
MRSTVAAAKYQSLRFLALLLAAVSELTALNPDFSLRQYVHTAWTEANGAALPEIRVLAQDAGGYLWLGTAQGLIRFDGLRFSRWEPLATRLPVEDIFSLAASRGGGLWVASHTTICLVQDRNVRQCSNVGHPPDSGIIGLIESEAGAAWFLSAGHDSRGVVTTVGTIAPDGAVQTFGQADRLPEGPIRAIAPGGMRKVLWLVRDADACQWSPGSEAVCWPYPARDLLSPGRRVRGELTIGRILDPGLDRPSDPPRATQGAAEAFRDREGALWAVTSEGLLRLRGDRLEQFTRRDGLSGNIAASLLEDREGDLWVATDTGIDRFRDPAAFHWSTLNGLTSDTTHAMAATPDGAVWVATGNGNLDRILNGRVTRFTWAESAKSNAALALYADSTGRLWVGSTFGLFEQVNEGFREVAAPDGGHLKHVDSISGDRAGNVWVMDQEHGPLQVRGAATEPVRLPRIFMPFRIAAGTDGTIWASSYKDGLLALRRADVVKSVLHEGPTHFIYEDRNREIWVGMGASLSRFRNGRWTTWGTADGLPDEFLYSMAEDDRGSFWILTPNAVLRLDAAELRRAADGAPKPLRPFFYGLTDGLRLTARGVPSPRLIKSADGRIWFCEANGVGVIDPAALHHDPSPPPVHIEDVQWNGKPLGGSGQPLSFKTGEVHIAYNAISLAAPERLRFKYRLEPTGQWIDAGARRDVTYAGLAPGRYRFSVAAGSVDGLWNGNGASLEFRVEPYVYQTAWFALACFATIGLMVYGFHRLRVRRLTEQFQLVAQERARVARELHDSLLQGFAGVVFQLDGAWRQFDTDPEQSKLRLEGALDRADQAMREAREVLSTMRLPALDDHTLPEALAETGAKLTQDTQTAFYAKVKGIVVPLRYEVQANVFLIGREAIANAVRHAEAGRIDVLLDYTDKEFRLTLQDDGQGFDLKAENPSGHWGLHNMQERARNIGAAFDLETAPGKGTRIQVKVRRKPSPHVA